MSAKISAALPSLQISQNLIEKIGIYFDLYEACSLSNAEVCEFCDSMLGVGVLATIGRFCTCLYPHPHSKPIIFPLRLISRHFLASHRMLRL